MPNPNKKPQVENKLTTSELLVVKRISKQTHMDWVEFSFKKEVESANK